MFTYNFYLNMFLLYNARLVNKEWRTPEEENHVRKHEKMFAERAAELLPDTKISFRPTLTASN